MHQSWPDTPKGLLSRRPSLPPWCRSWSAHSDREIFVNEEALAIADRRAEPSKVMFIDSEHGAVQDEITERNVSEAVIQEPEAPVRKVSKFKAARMKSK